ncbi:MULTISPECIES: ribonuclease III [Methylomonas]|uniref:Ribonuclease 3 n=1 Tax=Methylomonas koyamae TaxID=702114 RepID=A0A177N1Y7_9GAMM|nr:ribonuclease III [Methylomonas koyamae]OAI11966.1 ribonuclease III [Methylomonas koyamae]
MIKKPEILAKKLGLTFQNPGLLSVALTHRSVGAKNNERLEYLGDSVLGFVIAQKLYESFPEAGEGVLSRLRASLVNQNSLAELARQHNLGEYLILGSGELKSGGFRRDSILSDALEAIMGALVEDQGVEACRTWILELFAGKLAELKADDWVKDPKTRLQELMQAKRKPLPIYELVAMSGVDHAQTFEVRCKVAVTDQVSLASGISRKKAEQAAAEKMLNLLLNTDK